MKIWERLTILLYCDYRYTMRHLKSSNERDIVHAP